MLRSNYTPRTYTRIKTFNTCILALCHSCSNKLKCCSILALVCNQESTWREHKPGIPRVGGRSWLCRGRDRAICGKFRFVLKALRGRQNEWRYQNLQQAKAVEHGNQEKASSTISLLSVIRGFWFHELGSWSWWGCNFFFVSRLRTCHNPCHVCIYLAV